MGEKERGRGQSSRVTRLSGVGLRGWGGMLGDTLVEEGVCVCVIEVQWQAICSEGEE